MTKYYKGVRYESGNISLVDGKAYDSIGAAAWTAEEIKAHAYQDTDHAVILTVVKAYQTETLVVEVQ